MARLSEQIEIIIAWMRSRHPEISIGEQCAREMEEMIRRSMPGEKVYVPAPDTSKKQMVLDAARKLPTGVVAQRCGVSSRYVQRLIKKRN